MPSVTFDGQSLSVRGRRIWLAAAEFHSALTRREAWGDRLRELAEAGFNTIVLPCVWGVHEARQGRLDFAGPHALREVVERAAEYGLWVILKAGPVVGEPYPGGGLPAWLSDVKGIRLREPNAAFFERVTAWYRGLAKALEGLLASDVPSAAHRKARPGADTGPIVAVQLEQEWHCGQEQLAETYLSELARFAREVGFNVPLLTANDSFATIDAAIDVLHVRDQPLAHMRQLASLRPGFARFARVGAAGDAERAELMALSTAGAAQFMVTDEGAARDPLTRRVARFASSFGHVLAQLDPQRTGVVVDPAVQPRSGPTVLPVRGPAGTVAFVLGGDVAARKSTKAAGASTLPLLSADGRSFEVTPTATGPSWFIFDVDLAGKTRIDHATVTPLLHVHGTTILFVGPAGAPAEVSINGSAIALTVPTAGAGSKPAVSKLFGTTVVLCNDSQADAANVVGDTIVIGARAAGEAGRFRLLPGWKAATIVKADGSLATLPKDLIVPEPARREARPVASWAMASDQELVDGASHRYAMLDGPASLAACGAREGLGWYRVTFKRATAGKVSVHAPELADGALVWHNGSFIATLGAGLGHGAAPRSLPLELRLGAGQHTVVLLVFEGDRPSSGNHIGRRAGLYGPLVEVQAVKGPPKIERDVQVDPFALGVVQDLHPGDARPGISLLWKIARRKAERFILDVDVDVRAALGGATVTVDGLPTARWNREGPGGIALPIPTVKAAEIPMSKSGKPSKRGAARVAEPKTGPLEIRVILDGDADDAALARIVKGMHLHEVIGPLGGTPNHSFARWAPPATWKGGATKASKGAPVWYGASVEGGELAVGGRDALAAIVVVDGARVRPVADAAIAIGAGSHQVACFDPFGGPPPAITVS